MPVCFVIMGFGQKTDLATGRVLDLDKSYKNIIKPAVASAGYECVRADEIQHSGVIDVPMYEMLFAADLVVADLSTANLNAIFELGVRLALKPRSTIVIAESKFTIPFDAHHILVLHYDHLGPDIDYDEAMRMQGELTRAITALKAGDAVDSPVYTMLPDLQKPTRPSTTRMSVAAAATQTQSSDDSYAAKLQTAREAMNEGSFGLAKKILQGIYLEQTAPGADGKPKPGRPFVVQMLALATYKAGEQAAKTDGPARALAGYAEAEALLLNLDVEATTDPETLGIWGAVHKRRAEVATRSPEERKQDLDEAIRASERGLIIKRDYYNGTNLAYLLNLRASLSSGNDRIADNVWADRVRREVVDITARRLDALEKSSVRDEITLQEEKYWTAATHAESLTALGDQSGEELMRKIVASAPSPWMAESTRSQLERLKDLLAVARSPTLAEDKRYYVSYAWADPVNPNRERDVDRLCEEWKKRGVEIFRDKTTLIHGDLISDFMRRIGEGDRVFVFLSEKYLHSPYCMFELFEMWRNSRQNSSEFLGRVRFFTIGGAKIGEPLDWLGYTRFWQKERDKLLRAIEEVGWKDAGDELIKRYKLMETFAGKISDVLALFADVVQPRTFEEFLQYGFGDPPSARVH